MSKIKPLPEQLIDKIAAGEIIERPASIVKELIENAIDAGADDITVEIEEGGKKSIVVSDNGEGMDGSDLKLAIQRFTTSKISSEDDLFKIATYGFRGEALPSIASVSRMKIISRSSDDDSGHYLISEQGGIAEYGRVQRQKGTTVEIRDIFYNLPARLKFLKSNTTEYQHIFDLVSKISFSNLNRSFTLLRNGKSDLMLKKGETLIKRVEKIWRTGLEGLVMKINYLSSSGSVSGFIVSPHADTGGRKGIILFVNNRFVYDRIISHAVREAFKKISGKDEAPSSVIFVTVPYGTVDVNVHPAKSEVRFEKSFEIHRFMYQIIENTLKKDPLSAKAASYATPSSFRIPPGEEYFKNEYLCPSKADGVDLLSEALLPYKKKGYFESLKYLGSYFDEYLVFSSGEDGLILIDQHAAFERIAFEKLKKIYAVKCEVKKVSLLFPKVISTDKKEAVIITGNLSKLEKSGFEIEQAGENDFVIKSAPEGIKGDFEKILWGILNDLDEYGASTKSAELNEKILMTIACHSVVRGPEKLGLIEINDLLSKLDSIDFSISCPHGRPVYVKLDRSLTEKLFKRR